MKRMIIIVAICALLPAGGCGSHGVPVARVVTSFPDDGTQSYETVYEDGKVKKTTSSRRKGRDLPAGSRKAWRRRIVK